MAAESQVLPSLLVLCSPGGRGFAISRSEATYRRQRARSLWPFYWLDEAGAQTGYRAICKEPLGRLSFFFSYLLLL